MLHHKYTSAANGALVPSCFLLEEAAKLQPIVGPTFLSADREHVTAHQPITTPSFLADSTNTMSYFRPAIGCNGRFKATIHLKPETLLMFAWSPYDPENCTVHGILVYHLLLSLEGMLAFGGTVSTIRSLVRICLRKQFAPTVDSDTKQTVRPMASHKTFLTMKVGRDCAITRRCYYRSSLLQRDWKAKGASFHSGSAMELYGRPLLHSAS